MLTQGRSLVVQVVAPVCRGSNANEGVGARMDASRSRGNIKAAGRWVWGSRWWWAVGGWRAAWGVTILLAAPARRVHKE